MAAAASSTMEISRRHSSSSSIGSNRLRAISSTSARMEPSASSARLGAGADDEGALVFLEHGRAVDVDAGLERVAVPDLRRQRLARVGEEHRPRALQRRGRGMARQFQRAAAARHRRAGRQAQRDELDGGARRRAGEQRLVGRLERRSHPGLGDRRRQRHRDLAALADVTHVGQAPDGAMLDVRAGETQDVDRLLLQAGEDARRGG